MPQFDPKWFPIKVELEHTKEIKILTYDEYIKGKYSFIVLDYNVKV